MPVVLPLLILVAKLWLAVWVRAARSSQLASCALAARAFLHPRGVAGSCPMGIVTIRQLRSGFELIGLGLILYRFSYPDS